MRAVVLLLAVTLASPALAERSAEEIEREVAAEASAEQAAIDAENAMMRAVAAALRGGAIVLDSEAGTVGDGLEAMRAELLAALRSFNSEVTEAEIRDAARAMKQAAQLLEEQAGPAE